MGLQIGLIIGDQCQLDDKFLNQASTQIIETPQGLPVTIKVTDKWAICSRSGFEPPYRMPHESLTLASLSAFSALAIDEVVGLHTSGSLRPSLAPGMLIIPDDWINFICHQTTLSGQRTYITPSFSKKVRQALVDAAWRAEVRFENGGVYWQSRGPRLETKAEIKLMSNFADVVGMSLATEASLAQEMGIEYAAICSVDNYANGLGAPNLDGSIIWEQSCKSAPIFAKVLGEYSSPCF